MEAINAAGLSTWSISDGVVVGDSRLDMESLLNANVSEASLMFDAMPMDKENTARQILNNTVDSTASPAPVFGQISLPSADIQQAAGLTLQAATSSSPAANSPNSSLAPFVTNQSTPEVSRSDHHFITFFDSHTSGFRLWQLHISTEYG